MASVVGVVNDALLRIGSERITDLTDGSPPANRALVIYEDTRDTLLRSHTWAFATKRKKLAQSARTPAYEFDYQYPVPSDYLRLIEVHDNDAGTGALIYRLEFDGEGTSDDGTVIVTNATEVYIRYVARVTDPNRMPPDFRRAWAALMATDLAISIANSNSIRDRMERAFRSEILGARSSGSIEDYPEPLPDGSWVTNR